MPTRAGDAETGAKFLVRTNLGFGSGRKSMRLPVTVEVQNTIVFTAVSEGVEAPMLIRAEYRFGGSHGIYWTKHTMKLASPITATSGEWSRTTGGGCYPRGRGYSAEQRVSAPSRHALLRARKAM